MFKDECLGFWIRSREARWGEHSLGKNGTSVNLSNRRELRYRRCPPTQKTRVERLKEKTGALSIQVTVERGTYKTVEGQILASALRSLKRSTLIARFKSSKRLTL